MVAALALHMALGLRVLAIEFLRRSRAHGGRGFGLHRRRLRLGLSFLLNAG